MDLWTFKELTKDMPDNTEIVLAANLPLDESPPGLFFDAVPYDRYEMVGDKPPVYVLVPGDVAARDMELSRRAARKHFQRHGFKK